MDDIKHILVVSRMTKVDRKAFQYGVSLARATGAGLSLLSLVPGFFGDESRKTFSQSRELDYHPGLTSLKRRLDDLVELERSRGLRVKKLTKEGPPAEVIVKTAVEELIDLLILPAHEEGKMEHYLFCRGTDDIIKKLPCSILLVQEDVRSNT